MIIFFLKSTLNSSLNALPLKVGVDFLDGNWRAFTLLTSTAIKTSCWSGIFLNQIGTNSWLCTVFKWWPISTFGYCLIVLDDLRLTSSSSLWFLTDATVEYYFSEAINESLLGWLLERSWINLRANLFSWVAYDWHSSFLLQSSCFNTLFCCITDSSCSVSTYELWKLATDPFLSKLPWSYIRLHPPLSAPNYVLSAALLLTSWSLRETVDWGNWPTLAKSGFSKRVGPPSMSLMLCLANSFLTKDVCWS